MAAIGLTGLKATSLVVSTLGLCFYPIVWCDVGFDEESDVGFNSLGLPGEGKTTASSLVSNVTSQANVVISPSSEAGGMPAVTAAVSPATATVVISPTLLEVTSSAAAISSPATATMSTEAAEKSTLSVTTSQGGVVVLTTPAPAAASFKQVVISPEAEEAPPAGMSTATTSMSTATTGMGTATTGMSTATTGSHSTPQSIIYQQILKTSDVLKNGTQR